jgi:hypothetical protein
MAKKKDEILAELKLAELEEGRTGLVAKFLENEKPVVDEKPKEVKKGKK